MTYDIPDQTAFDVLGHFLTELPDTEPMILRPPVDATAIGMAKRLWAIAQIEGGAATIPANMHAMTFP